MSKYTYDMSRQALSILDEKIEKNRREVKWLDYDHDRYLKDRENLQTLSDLLLKEQSLDRLLDEYLSDGLTAEAVATVRQELASGPQATKFAELDILIPVDQDSQAKPVAGESGYVTSFVPPAGVDLSNYYKEAADQVSKQADLDKPDA